MKKLELYVDTSVWNMAFDEHVPERMNPTRIFFQQARSGDYVLHVSGVVLQEISDAPLERRREVAQLIDELKPDVIQETDADIALAEEYLSESVLPVTCRADALHIAIAVLNRMDAIISWNMKHMVSLSVKRKVNAVNMRDGYHTIEIITPEEVI